MTPDRLIDISVVAREFDVSIVTVRNWIRSGKLKAERTLTGRYKVRASVLATKRKESKDVDGSI